MDSSELKNSLNDLKIRLDDIKDGVFDINSKEKRLKEIESELSKEEIWSDLDLSQKISKEKTALEKTLNSFKSVEEKVTDGLMFIDIAEEEGDDKSISEILESFQSLEQSVAELEFSKMFTNKMDSASAYVEIQSGSGGTEAQDWAEMLLRMYTKWSEGRGFNSDLIEISHGDVAGIKSATLHVSGEYSYGWLRTETGIHRLVRKSEQRPLARWGEGGYLNHEGEVFAATADPLYQDLPLLIGPDGAEGSLMRRYQALAGLLEPTGLQISELSLDPLGQVAVRFDSGLSLLLGAKDISHRVTRFKRLWEEELPAQTVAIVDLRYEYGAAVTFSDTELAMQGAQNRGEG